MQNCKVTFINRTSYPYGKRLQFQTRDGITFAVVYKPNTSQNQSPIILIASYRWIPPAIDGYPQIPMGYSKSGETFLLSSYV
jgi:hypothetical protein